MIKKHNLETTRKKTIRIFIATSLVISTIKSGVTGKGTGVGKISMDFEELDSQTNLYLFLAVSTFAAPTDLLPFVGIDPA